MRTFSTGTQGFKNLPVFASSSIIALVCLLLTSYIAFAHGRGTNSSSSHESERAAQVRSLNNSVLQLHGQLQENASGAVGVRGQAATVLAQRAAALQAVIQEDPHAALSFAFSPELLADLATKFPGASSQLESHVALTGTVEHWVADSADMKSSKESWYINASGSLLELHFGTARRPGPDSGSTITIEGVQLGSHVAVSRLSSSPVYSGSFVIPNGPFEEGNLSQVLVLLLASLALGVALKSRVSPTASAIPRLARRAAVCCLALLVVMLSSMGV